MNIQDKQKKIIGEFSTLEDWNDAYDHIIKIGKSLPAYPEKYKTEEYLIKGCQSKVWLKADYNEGKVTFIADSDTAIIKGIIALLIDVTSSHTPEEIIEADNNFMQEIGLKDFLAPTRSNGLVAMINQIKNYASELRVN